MKTRFVVVSLHVVLPFFLSSWFSWYQGWLSHVHSWTNHKHLEILRPWIYPVLYNSFLGLGGWFWERSSSWYLIQWYYWHDLVYTPYIRVCVSQLSICSIRYINKYGCQLPHHTFIYKQPAEFGLLILGFLPFVFYLSFASIFISPQVGSIDLHEKKQRDSTQCKCIGFYKLFRHKLKR